MLKLFHLQPSYLKLSLKNLWKMKILKKNALSILEIISYKDKIKKKPTKVIVVIRIADNINTLTINCLP